MWRVTAILALALFIGACAHQQPQQQAHGGYYTVKPGETLYSIAFALDVNPEVLRQANPIADPLNPLPGFVLTIPRQMSMRAPLQVDDSEQDVFEAEAQYIWPLTRIDVSSPFGRRHKRMHTGIDLRAPRGTPIYASAAGEVIFSGHYGGYGHLIIIDHGNGIETAYGHNKRNLVKKGQRVKQGQIIGTVGRTGNATGNHVHFEYRVQGKPVNPVRHLQAAL